MHEVSLGEQGFLATYPTMRSTNGPKTYGMAKGQHAACVLIEELRFRGL